MCGIAGTYGGNETQVAAMLDRIEHRGPDGRGLYTHGKAVHGHVRLALVDLTEGSAQPFKRNGSTLSFNGEIWNYKELKQGSDQHFSTTGDTEVLADQLDRLGLVCLPFLDGMFAFAWSSADGEHWLVRDSFGKIPLYVAKTPTGYFWASERKAFPRGLKPIAVPPGHAFNLVTGEWIKWYHLPAHRPTNASDVLDLLRDGVNKRLAADAPVCCLISGGLDSSIILALAQQRSKNVTAFTARFDSDADDLKSARRLCSDLGIRLIEVPVEISTALRQEAIHSIEIASKAQIEIAMLCLPLARRIYAEGFRACLSGEAADELFGGYGNFCIKASKMKGNEILPLRKEQLSKMSRGNFVRCNKAFMAAGVECRLPFMEQGLVERVVNLLKEESPTGKVLLKKAAAPLLPPWIIKRQKDTFQGGSGLAAEMARQIANPVIVYNNELRKEFGYLPKD
tara:strand:- start:9928 stop:11286 length:1359 start_codon:yes stop_codon:yes gene_type:complete